MSSLSIQIQDAVVRRLAALGASGVPVHGLLRGDMVSVVNATIERLGLCVEVVPAIPTRINGNIPGPFVEAMQFAVRVVENPMLNTSALTRWDVMEQIIVTLEGWQPAIEGSQPCAVEPTVSEQLIDGVLELELTASIGGSMLAAAVPVELAAVALSSLDSGVLKRGTAAMVSGPEGLSAEVVFETPFVAPPRVVLVRMINPDGATAYVAAVVTDSVTAEGMSIAGTTEVPEAEPIEGYSAAWLALV